MSDRRLLTGREVAEELSLSVETILRMVRRGDLPAIKLPSGALRFRPAEIDRWLDDRATPTRGVSPAQESAARRLG